MNIKFIEKNRKYYYNKNKNKIDILNILLNKIEKENNNELPKTIINVIYYSSKECLEDTFKNNIFSTHLIKEKCKQFNKKHEIYINLNEAYFKNKINEEIKNNKNIDIKNIENFFFNTWIEDIKKTLTEVLFFVIQTQGKTPNEIHESFKNKKNQNDVYDYKFYILLEKNKEEYYFNKILKDKIKTIEIYENKLNRISYEKFKKVIIKNELKNNFFNSLENKKRNKNTN